MDKRYAYWLIRLGTAISWYRTFTLLKAKLLFWVYKRRWVEVHGRIYRRIAMHFLMEGALARIEEQILEDIHKETLNLQYKAKRTPIREN